MRDLSLKVNHRITHTVNELNLFAVQKSTAVSVVRSVPCLTLAKGKNRKVPAAER